MRSAPEPRGVASNERVGDFTTTTRVVPIALLAIVVGAASAFVALALLRLIGLFTNLFFFQRWSFAPASPAAHTLGPIVAVLVPVVGCLVIGVMARYGSERIRGHGIPEALEAILTEKMARRGFSRMIGARPGRPATTARAPKRSARFRHSCVSCRRSLLPRSRCAW